MSNGAELAREKLLQCVQPDGGWGYRPGQASHLEPTCLALLALSGDRNRYQQAITNGLASLNQHSHTDGSYRLSRGRPQAAWPTALVLFTKTILEEPETILKPIRDRLLTLEGKTVERDPEIANMVDIDTALLGWSWAEDTFSWVEPTAWACLALRANNLGNHTRVAEGLRLLVDRAFDTGGVNYGNRVTLGKPTEPIPGPTAVMLLAVQNVPDNARVEAAKGYLRVQAGKNTDLEHLAWIRIALARHANDEATRQTVAELGPKIEDALQFELPAENGLGAGPLRLALAAMALDVNIRNPFALTTEVTIGTGSTLKATRSTLDTDTPPAAKGIIGKLKERMLNGLDKLRPLPATSAVHIAKVDTYEAPIADILQKQFEHYKALLPIQGKRVVLKPNFVEYFKDRVINTDVRFIAGVIELFQREGAKEITVAEGPGHWRNAQYLVEASGLGDVLRKFGVRFVDVNHDEPVKLPNLGRLTGLEHLYFSKTVAEAEVFVSLPKLKMHHWAGVTLSLKNLFGTLPGICYGWPKNELHWRGIPRSIVDIALTRTPHLAIVDGIMAMDGDGPINGNPRQMGAIIMGMDCVAVDATGARLMQMPPERLLTLMLAQEKRLGWAEEARIPQLGESIESLSQPFEWPPQVEKHLLPAKVALS